MQQLEQYLQLIEKEISNSKQTIAQELEVNELYAPIQHILSIGGKRLRPALVLMGTALFNEDVELAIRPAVGIEVFHNFTLLHDDIMDQAPIRRGHETVHKKWNENIAILSGDAMMIKSYDFLTDLPPALFKEVFAVFNRTAIEVCIGQQHDMNFETRNDVKIEEYLEMIRLKTSVLIAGALKIGGLIGGGSTADVNALYDFALNLGLAFQMQDDILDVYADEALFGKKIGGDILANKKTFLLIKAQELADPTTAKELATWLDKTNYKPAEKIAAVMDIYNRLSIREVTENMQEEYYKKAIEALMKIENTSDRLQPLLDFADWLMKRQK